MGITAFIYNNETKPRDEERGCRTQNEREEKTLGSARGLVWVGRTGVRPTGECRHWCWNLNLLSRIWRLLARLCAIEVSTWMNLPPPSSSSSVILSSNLSLKWRSETNVINCTTSFADQHKPIGWVVKAQWKGMLC